MPKFRISKSEIDIYIQRLIRKGFVKLSDTKEGNKRIVEFDHSRVIFSSNGWVEFIPK